MTHAKALLMCSFPDCPNHASPKASRGLCSSHYWQLHKGRPLTPLAYRRNVTEPWLLQYVDYQGDECLIWPFQHLQDSGMAAVKWKGRQSIASRVMCELAHGKPPTSKHEAAHSCGKGHLGCVNPKHLRWATHTENVADQLIHGTRFRGEAMPWAKLTDKRVRAIREFAHTCTPRTIARLFGLETEHVRKVLDRTIWGHVV